MRVLIIGGSGFLGSELVRQGAAAGLEVAATYATRPGAGTTARWHRLDLRQDQRVAQVIADAAPHAVVNASSGLADWAVTAEGAIRVAMAAAEQHRRLVHVSSDAVFSGARPHYAESCLPDPLTPYGAAKAAAETGVRLVAPDAVVARTSLIIGDGASGHERHVHALATGARDGVLFTDDVRCPVHVADLAAALLELAVSEPLESGVRHLAGPDALSRHQLDEPRGGGAVRQPPRQGRPGIGPWPCRAAGTCRRPRGGSRPVPPPASPCHRPATRGAHAPVVPGSDPRWRRRRWQP